MYSIRSGAASARRAGEGLPGGAFTLWRNALDALSGGSGPAKAELRCWRYGGQRLVFDLVAKVIVAADR